MQNTANTFPLVQDGTNIYTGGNQHWLAEELGQRAGCGSVSAANCLAALSLKNERIATALRLLPEANGVFSKERYLTFMEEMFGAVGSWNLAGLKTGVGITRLILQTLRYAKSKGVCLNVRTYPAPYIKKEKLRAFLREGLALSGAVILPAGWNHFIATYDNGQRVKIHKHYITFCGMSEDGETLEISTWGRHAWVTLEELYDSLQSPKAIDTALLYFKPAISEAETNKALLRAGMPLLSTVRSAVLRF